MVIKALLRNEWVEAYMADGVIIDEVPEGLIEEVKRVGEERKLMREQNGSTVVAVRQRAPGVLPSIPSTPGKILEFKEK